MKHFKSTFISLILLIGVGLYFYFFEKDKKTSEENLDLQIYKFNEDEIKKIELIQSKENIILEKKSEDKWQITSPLETKADSSVCKDMAKALSDFKAERVIEEQPQNFSIYGLDKPEIKVNIYLDKEIKTLFIGNKNPIGTFFYIKDKDKNSVYLISQFYIRKFNQSVEFLRDKKVVHVKTEDVNKIELCNLTLNEVFVCRKKKENFWQIEKPELVKADPKKIEEFIQKLINLQIEEFIEDKPKNLKQYGLAPFQLKVSLWTNENLETILFGKKGKNKIFIKKEKEKPIYLVQEDILKNLNVTAKDLQDDKLLRFDKDKIIKIKINEILLEKQGRKWKLPRKTKEEIETYILNMLSDLEFLNIEKLEETNPQDLVKYGLEKPVYIIELTDEKETRIISFGKTQNDLVYVKTNEMPSIYLVTTEVMKNIEKLTKKIEKK